jgi:hypothetical protein
LEKKSLKNTENLTIISNQFSIGLNVEMVSAKDYLRKVYGKSFELDDKMIIKIWASPIYLKVNNSDFLKLMKMVLHNFTSDDGKDSSYYYDF